MLFLFLLPLLIFVAATAIMVILLIAGCVLLARKRYAGAIKVGVAMLAIVGFCFWLFDNRVKIPSRARLTTAMNDGLRRDCANLSWSAVKIDFYHLDRRYWPKSIWDLHPRSVFVAGDAVLICLWHSCPEWERPFNLMEDKSLNVTLEVERDPGPKDFSQLTEIHAKISDGIYLSYYGELESKIRAGSDILDGAVFSGGRNLNPK